MVQRTVTGMDTAIDIPDIASASSTVPVVATLTWTSAAEWAVLTYRTQGHDPRFAAFVHLGVECYLRQISSAVHPDAQQLSFDAVIPSATTGTESQT